MFQDGFIDRLAGVLREYSADLDSHPLDKIIAIVNSVKRKGNEADIRKFVTDLCDIYADVPKAEKAEGERILYSSSLTEGKYVLLPYNQLGQYSSITCDCVHCGSKRLSTSMVAHISTDSITVFADCRDCGKDTEVYFVGLHRVEQLPQSEFPTPEHIPEVGGEG